MAKRGRKPKNERRGYFYEEQEAAVKKYLETEDPEERNEVFNTVLKPAFTKMIESIIRRYKLYVPEEEFEETFNDTMSFLSSKMGNFNPTKHYKAYSYYGTICKNFVVCQGNSPAQVEAITESVGDLARMELKEKPAHVVGLENAQWVAMDYTDVMVHIFLPDVREYYDLEHLWEDAQLTYIPDLD